MKLKLPDSVLTPQDLRGTVLEIRQYAAWTGHNAIRKRVSGKKGRLEAPELSDGAKELIRQCLEGKEPTRARLDDAV